MYAIFYNVIFAFLMFLENSVKSLLSKKQLSFSRSKMFHVA